MVYIQGESELCKLHVTKKEYIYIYIYTYIGLGTLSFWYSPANSLPFQLIFSTFVALIFLEGQKKPAIGRVRPSITFLMLFSVTD
jgi:hypothetical protein